MDFVFLLGQPTGIEGLSGGAGWVGAGLLGAVLSWLLLLYLPSKDKQTTALMDAHSQTVSTLYAEFAKERAILTENFNKALNIVIERSERDTDRSLNMIQQEIVTLRTAIQALAAAVDQLGKREGVVRNG